MNRSINLSPLSGVNLQTRSHNFYQPANHCDCFVRRYSVAQLSGRGCYKPTSQHITLPPTAPRGAVCCHHQLLPSICDDIHLALGQKQRPVQGRRQLLSLRERSERVCFAGGPFLP